MNDVLELIAATVRWSRESEQSKFFFSGTLWYGMMCRNFLLLERILRSIAHELSALAPHDAERIASERAQGKAIERMTFGQCFSVVEGIVPIVSQRIYVICPELAAQTASGLSSDKTGRVFVRFARLAPSRALPLDRLSASTASLHCRPLRRVSRRCLL